MSLSVRSVAVLQATLVTIAVRISMNATSSHVLTMEHVCIHMERSRVCVLLVQLAISVKS